MSVQKLRENIRTRNNVEIVIRKYVGRLMYWKVIISEHFIMNFHDLIRITRDTKLTHLRMRIIFQIIFVLQVQHIRR